MYIDLFENRSDKLRPLEEFALDVIRRTLDCEFRILISSLVVKEIKKCGYEKSLIDLKKQLENADKIDFVIESHIDKKQASKIHDISHYEDRLHYFIVVRARADFLITRNWKDFYGLGNLNVLLPEYL